MDYLTVKEIAQKWNISERRVTKYCTEKRIPGANKRGLMWFIPADATKPNDPRKPQNNKEKY